MTISLYTRLFVYTVCILARALVHSIIEIHGCSQYRALQGLAPLLHILKDYSTDVKFTNFGSYTIIHENFAHCLFWQHLSQSIEKHSKNGRVFWILENL